MWNKKKIGKLCSYCRCRCPCLRSTASGQLFILLVGLDNSGKTCIAKSLAGQSISNVAPTVGFSNVNIRYKGYNATLYDLGGSKNFRGIWPKYFHEVHGFIFVVDSSDESRIPECSDELSRFLKHDQVRGKPLLLLCHKSDKPHSLDEIHLVEALNVERLVNKAKCPTRVEPSFTMTTKKKGATNGLKDGFKWLLKTVISDIGDLGPRVDREIEREREKETQRRDEIRRRLRERNDDTDLESNHIEPNPSGFVPISTLTGGKSTEPTHNGNGVSNRPTKKWKTLRQLFSNKTAPIEEARKSETSV